MFLRFGSGAAAALGAAALVLAAAAAPAAFAQEDEDCLLCHGEADAQGTRDGKKVSVHVDAKTLAGSVHSKLTCVTCHEDLDGIERFPHGKVAPVDCAKPIGSSLMPLAVCASISWSTCTSPYATALGSLPNDRAISSYTCATDFALPVFLA